MGRRGPPAPPGGAASDHPPSPVSPWLCGLPPKVNHARLQLYLGRVGPAPGPAAGPPPAEPLPTAYLTDVPEEAFTAAMSRAARHAGYSPKELAFRAYHVRDLVLEDRMRQEPGPPPCADPPPPHAPGAGGGPPYSGGGDARLFQERVYGVHELAGAPVLVQLMQRTRLPFALFPCGAAAHDVRDVRALSLRVHARARLVFTVHRGQDHPGGTLVRSIHIDVDLGGNAKQLAADLPDLSRTVENTVQIVLMGARPRGRYGA